MRSSVGTCFRTCEKWHLVDKKDMIFQIGSSTACDTAYRFSASFIGRGQVKRRHRLKVAVKHHTLTKVRIGMIFLTGGFCDDGITTSVSDKAFKGVVCKTKDKDTWEWRETNSMSQPRAKHIAFKMGNNVYVAGGHNGKQFLNCCEVYDPLNQYWHPSPHSLPFPLYGASVTVSNDETFAVITGGFVSTCLLYTSDAADE